MPDWTPNPGETPIDPSGLLDKSIRNRTQLNEAEAQNIAEVVYQYLLGELDPEQATFAYDWTLKLHEEMFGRVWEWAGQTRRHDVNLGGPWHQVEIAIHDLLRNLPYWKDLPIIEQAARLHHGAVSIHPFENGNGRWARMLANIWLKRHDSPLTVWPEESVRDESVIREEYLRAIRAADAMDYSLLIDLHIRYSNDGTL